MTRDEFIQIVNSKIKLIRTEHNFTQDKMGEVIGISKKTLVQIEKGRGSLGWTGSVALCSLFRDSEILQMTLGEDFQDIILALAFTKHEDTYVKTLGGKVWWNEIQNNKQYKLQQNVISNHYRILDQNNSRVCSSLDQEYVFKRYEELSKGEKYDDN